jgi:ribonuclease D
VVRQRSEELTIPAENLVAPDAVRRLAWAPPQPITEESVAEHLAGNRARPWQIGLVAGPLAAALAAATTPE